MTNRFLLVLLLCCMVILSSCDEKAEEDSDEMEDWMKDLVNDGNYFVVASDGDPHEALEIMKKIRQSIQTMSSLSMMQTAYHHSQWKTF